MSNFSISQFSSALNALVAKSDERADALAGWLASSLEAASKSWLLEGSDSLSQCLGKIETCGKSSMATKLRKIVRSVEYTFRSDSETYGTVAGFSHVPAISLIGGNSPRVSDHAERQAACEEFGDTVRTVARFVLTPPTREGEVDPLATFGKLPKLATLAIKLAAASDEQVKSAVSRTQELLELLVAAANARAEVSVAPSEAEVSAASEAEEKAASEAEEKAAAAAAAAAEKLTTRAKRTTRRAVNE